MFNSYHLFDNNNLLSENVNKRERKEEESHSLMSCQIEYQMRCDFTSKMKNDEF